MERGRMGLTPTESCLDELAAHMHVEDLSSDLDGVQKINTYTVGFDIDPSAFGLDPVTDASAIGLLNDANALLDATGGAATGGEFYTANNVRQLTTRLREVFDTIATDNAIFVRPTVTANTFNRVSHDNDLYYSIFAPSNSARWLGNVKKYEIECVADPDNPDDTCATSRIVDKDGDPAIDPDTGAFVENSKSFWSHSTQEEDGGSASRGGIASRIFKYESGDFTADDRGVYTWVESSLIRNSPNNEVKGNCRGYFNYLWFRLSLADQDTLCPRLKEWARGVDLLDHDGDGDTTDARPVMGAPLHSEPILVTYGTDGRGNPKNVLFITTNDGFLHAFDTTTVTDGNASMELWATVSPSALHKFRALFEDAESRVPIYGAAGLSDVWIHDDNENGQILKPHHNVNAFHGFVPSTVVEPGDHVYYYYGERRGGRRIYGIDVSHPNSPRHLLTIAGATGSVHRERNSIGQTWSRPRFHRITDTSAPSGVKGVLIFGGGYDPSNDPDDPPDPGVEKLRDADAMGNAIFIADASNGNILWSVGKGIFHTIRRSAMKYAIPSDVRIVDINRDGAADRIYAVDIGGQVWRFDIADGPLSNLAGRITGDKIAELGGGDVHVEHNRRFFYPPDLALNIAEEGTSYISIAVGSGNRAHPKAEIVQDRFYVVKDYDVDAPPSVYKRIDVDTGGNFALHDVTLEANAAEADVEKGWYIDMKKTEGEKVLSIALTFAGAVLFSTYRPPPPPPDGTCAPDNDTGQSLVYGVDVHNGAPIANLDRTDPDEELDCRALGSCTVEDRSLELEAEGIPSNVTLTFPDHPSPLPHVVVGTELPDELSDVLAMRLNARDGRPRYTYWYRDNAE